MWNDGFFVTRKPLPNWSFRDAAANLIKNGAEFLHVPPGLSSPIGNWSLSCFPYDRYVDLPLNESHVEYIRSSVKDLLAIRSSRGMYYTIEDVAKAMKAVLAYPPYPFDKAPLEMRSWGVKMFWEKMCFHLPPDVALP